MNRPPLDLQTLAQRVAAGDLQARRQMQEQLGRHLERIVRRSLGRGGNTRLDGAIHAEASRHTDQPQADPQRWTQPVAQALEQRMLNRLWPGATLPGHDTLAVGSGCPS